MGISDGLARAHAAGIVHRDLKPENVRLPLEFAADPERRRRFARMFLAGKTRVTKRRCR